jgi:hypothetical protein
MEGIQYTSLVKEVKISPKSLVTLKQVWNSSTEMIVQAEVNIKIGVNGSAKLTMDLNSFNELKDTGVIQTKTLKEFRKNLKTI